MTRKLPSRPTPPVSMLVQDGHIRCRWPTFRRIGTEQASSWVGWMQPTSSSPRYEVKVVMKRGSPPAVRVINPLLIDKAPHTFPDHTLCLYYPPEWQWNGRRLLAETIFPWTAAWLFFYELWLATGQWLGPEAPHGDDKVAA